MTTAPKFYKVRLGNGRPAAGLKVWQGFPTDPETGETLERAYIWRCELNGVPTEINEVFEWWGDCGNTEVPGEQITEREYQFYAKDGEWAREFSPEDPSANPRKKVDMNKIAPIEW